jgi:hypothetical protein
MFISLLLTKVFRIMILFKTNFFINNWKVSDSSNARQFFLWNTTGQYLPLYISYNDNSKFQQNFKTNI